MKVVVISNFYDFQAELPRTKGEVLELSKPRALELIALGWLEEIQEPKPKKKSKK